MDLHAKIKVEKGFDLYAFIGFEADTNIKGQYVKEKEMDYTPQYYYGGWVKMSLGKYYHFFHLGLN